MPNEYFDSLKSNLKTYFTSDQFFQSFGSLKIAHSGMRWGSGLIYAHFEDNNYNPESVTPIIYVW